MELTFKTFDKKTNLAEQRSLFRECFPETVGTPMETDAHYFWKFHGFPSAIKSYEYAAWAGDDMIGYYAAIPYRYRIGKRETTVGMVCDVMTGVKARGKGVFTKMGFYATNAMKEEGLDFVTGYPIRPEVIPGHIKVGWRIVFKMPIYIRFIKTNTVMKKYKLGLLSAVGNAGAYMYNFFVANERRSTGFTFEMLKKEDYFKLKDYDEFFSRWQVSIDNPLQKNHEFMKWRLGAPGTEYRIVTVRKNMKLVGVAVTRKSVMEGIPVLAILDMMVLPGNEKCLGGINRMFRNVANSHGVEAIVTMMSRKWAKFYSMFQLGFIASPYIFSLIIKKLNPDIDDEMLFDDRRWHLMWVDSDDL